MSSTKHPWNVIQKETREGVSSRRHVLAGQKTDLTTAEVTIQTTHIPKTSNPHTSTESHTVVVDARRPKGPAGQPSTQAEVFATNTDAWNLSPSSSQQQQQHNQDLHWETEAQEDQHQDSEDELEAVIEEVLASLHQINESLRLGQEHVAQWRVVVKRAQMMQQQIEQERTMQTELQQAIEALR
jgi:hypothetical protein